MKGAYCLVMLLRKDCRIRVGALGVIEFRGGIYVYVGSAQSGVERRLERHTRSVKRRRWHIDYLLTRAEIVSNAVISTERKDDECEIARSLMQVDGAEVAVPGFGSSDCRCDSHLVFFENDDFESVMEAMATRLSFLGCIYPRSI